MKNILVLSLGLLASNISQAFEKNDYKKMEIKKTFDNEISKEKWKKYNFKNYSYLIKKNCWCINKLTRVYVIDEQVVFAEALEIYNKKMNLKEFKTINQYNEDIESYYAKKPIRFEVNYDLSFGFPVKFSVDPDGNTVDDEFGFQIFEVVPLEKKNK